VIGTFTASHASDAVWGYTAAPDLVVCDDIVTMLKNYMGSGQSLADINSNRQISVGDPAPPGADAISERPFIGIYSDPSGFDINEDADEYVFPITAKILTERLFSDADVLQESWKYSREIQAAIWSAILEQWKLLQEDSFRKFWLGPPTLDGPMIEEDGGPT
jgi:hypothetical protein